MKDLQALLVFLMAADSRNRIDAIPIDNRTSTQNDQQAKNIQIYNQLINWAFDGENYEGITGQPAPFGGG